MMGHTHSKALLVFCLLAFSSLVLVACDGGSSPPRQNTVGLGPGAMNAVSCSEDTIRNHRGNGMGREYDFLVGSPSPGHR